MKHLFFLSFFIVFHLNAVVKVGLDRLFVPEYVNFLKGKKIGLVTNHTAINQDHVPAAHLFYENQELFNYELIAYFAPEHGLFGKSYAYEIDVEENAFEGIPIFQISGKNARPADQMLDNITLLVYDIQDIGSRSYTFISTLFYVMEAAAKKNIPILVLDRPNPLGGLVVDGPMLEEKWRSTVGYINIPYCHGMTVAELAELFNDVYKVGCKLFTVPMRGWKRDMEFTQTGLSWIPTSPHIPEASTAFFYPTTGILGELQIVSIGIGYTLPFKLVGAPWINGEEFAQQLNKQKFPGVVFHPIQYRPFYGKFASEVCNGILILITDHTVYKPVSTQYLILGMLKSLYPDKFQEALEASKNRREMFNKVNGTEKVLKAMLNEKYITWHLLNIHKTERELFAQARKKYLIYD